MDRYRIPIIENPIEHFYNNLKNFYYDEYVGAFDVYTYELPIPARIDMTLTDNGVIVHNDISHIPSFNNVSFIRNIQMTKEYNAIIFDVPVYYILHGIDVDGICSFIFVFNSEQDATFFYSKISQKISSFLSNFAYERRGGTRNRPAANRVRRGLIFVDGGMGAPGAPDDDDDDDIFFDDGINIEIG